MEAQGVEFIVGTVPPAMADPRSVSPAPAPPDWRLGLRRAVASQVLPRLAERGRDRLRADDAAPALEVQRFSDLATGGDLGGLLARAAALRAGGMPVEAVVERFMGPAARRLGDLWLEDRLGFVEVTAALGSLQALLRSLDPGPDTDIPVGPRRILLAPVPGEQHVFGLSVVAMSFRRAGWDVAFEPRIAFADLVERVRSEPFTAVGLSAAGDRFLSALPAQIAALRRASCEPDVIMMAGGPAFLARAEARNGVGADVVALDGGEALRNAEALLARIVQARSAPADARR